MKTWILGLSATGLLVAAPLLAQERGPGGPFGGPAFREGRPAMSPSDMDAFTDARIAALHAGLKLNAEQEKMWPPVEDAIRGLAKQRREARDARRDRYASAREQGPDRDIPGALRFMADRQAASAETLRKLADAAEPLYRSLDDGQKRRMAVLARGLGIGRPDGAGPMRRGEAGPLGRDFASGRGPIR